MSQDTPRTLGMVGLGNMGSLMAGQLIDKGFTVIVYDTRASQTEAFLTAHPKGASVARTLGELARKSELVLASLPDGKIVHRVVFDGPADEHLAGNMPRGTIFVDMSSSAPMDTLRLAEELTPLGITVVDAPVSGGTRRAANGTLAVMVGGDPAVAERCRPIFEAIGKQIFLTGPLGSGHAMKALNNYVSAASLQASVEALIVGRKFGLDPALMTDVINASSGRNNQTETKMKQFVLSGTFDAGFSMAFMAKDVGIAVDLAKALQVDTPLAAACLEEWSKASADLGPAADHTEIARWLEKKTGTELAAR